MQELAASMERVGRGPSSQTWLLKMHNLEQGLTAELEALDNLCCHLATSDVKLYESLKEERSKLMEERELRLIFAFRRLKEPINIASGLDDLAVSLDKVSRITQTIVNMVQMNWNEFDGHAMRSGRDRPVEDFFSLLSVSDREDSTTVSLESSDPSDLPGLLHVYAAQFNSHSLLVRGTADEFLGCLQAKVNEPKQSRGYHLPTAGVLIANAKFLLRCSSQLVNLAASLSAALQNSPQSDAGVCIIDIDKLRIDIEVAGNSVCEALKGLIAQTKEAAGYLSSPGLDVPITATTLASKPVISGPEMERLVGAIQGVVISTENLRHLVSNGLGMRAGGVVWSEKL